MKNSILVSHKAKQIGFNLICELNIQNGFGLSKYLSVNNCHDNHSAILIWIDRLFEDNPGELTKQEIINHLFQKLPDCIFN